MEKTVKIVLLMTLILVLIDVASTYVCIEQMGRVEKNPISAWILSNIPYKLGYGIIFIVSYIGFSGFIIGWHQLVEKFAEKHNLKYSVFITATIFWIAYFIYIYTYNLQAIYA